MRFKRRSASLVAAAMGALILAPIQPQFAQASVTAKTNNLLNVQSGSLLIFATATQSFVNPLARLSTSISNNTPKTFFIDNGGTLSTGGFAMILTLPNNSNISTFKRCALNVAFTGSNSCATGSPVTLTKPVSGTPTTYLYSLPVNGFYSFQITQNKTGTLMVNTYANSSHVITSTSNS